MTRRLLLVLACVGVLTSVAPGAARADDATLAGAVATWSLKVAAPARVLERFSETTSMAQALRASQQLAAVAARGERAIARQRPSSARGRSLKLLAVSAFADFARAGNLLAAAIRDLRAGRNQALIGRNVDRAVALATRGGKRLSRAAAIIPKLL